MSRATAEFRCDFDLESIEVRIESRSFHGRGTVTLYEDNVRRLQAFISSLDAYPLPRTTVEISEPGNILILASPYDHVGHLSISVQVKDGPCMAQVAIRVDYPGLALFGQHLTKMLDGKLDAFDLVQTTT